MTAREIAEAIKAHWGRPVTATLQNGKQVKEVLRSASLFMPEWEIRPGVVVPDPPAEGTVKVGDDVFNIGDLVSIH